jgi:hypothetical protein
VDSGWGRAAEDVVPSCRVAVFSKFASPPRPPLPNGAACPLPPPSCLGSLLHDGIVMHSFAARRCQHSRHDRHPPPPLLASFVRYALRKLVGHWRASCAQERREVRVRVCAAGGARRCPHPRAKNACAEAVITGVQPPLAASLRAHKLCVKLVQVTCTACERARKAPPKAHAPAQPSS